MIGHYLKFNRNCSEALELYCKAFDVQLAEKQSYSDMPPNPAFPVAEADKNLVLHSRIVIDGTEIMCADSSSGIETGNNMYISFMAKDVATAQKAWDILKAGGEVYMELSPQFFAAAHGSLRDKFGVNWMFTVSK